MNPSTPASSPALPSAEARPWRLARDAQGQLQWIGPASPPEPVTPVRAFPLSAPDQGLSLVGADGRERAWIDALDMLDATERALLDEALAPRDFAPVLQRLHRVSSFGVPSTWQVDTDRGPTHFVLKAEEDIRRLEGGALRITSAHGLQFCIPDPRTLDRHSRKLLERFL